MKHFFYCDVAQSCKNIAKVFLGFIRMLNFLVSNLQKRVLYSLKFGLVLCLFMQVGSHAYSHGFYCDKTSFGTCTINVADTTHIQAAIAFGQTIPVHFLSNITEKTDWGIFKNKELLMKGNGLDITRFVFDTPGDYTVTTLNKHEHIVDGCNHPDAFSIISLNVNEVKVEMEYDKSFWHQLFTSKKTLNKHSVQVPVKISYYGKAVAIKELSLYLAGVNCNLIGKSKEIALGQNKTVLLVPFELTGTVGSGIYASLDFIDHNKNTVSFPITELIK